LYRQGVAPLDQARWIKTPASNLSNTLLFERVWYNEGGRFEGGRFEGGRFEGRCCSKKTRSLVNASTRLVQWVKDRIENWRMTK
jgi:hypothetical protein